MAWLTTARIEGADTAGLLIACVSHEGSASHPYFSDRGMADGEEGIRNLADAVHFLSLLHGRYPGVIEHAAARTDDEPARSWLRQAEEAMGVERSYLAKLVVEAGPVPGTPGAGMSEAAVLNQRNALGILAQSDRRGCALGAALAFALDWIEIRTLLDLLARRVGFSAPGSRLGSIDTLQAVANGSGATERALLFGAHQLALQHRSLWDLLEARREARR